MGVASEFIQHVKVKIQNIPIFLNNQSKLVNLSLKSLNMAYTLIFLLKKCEWRLHLQKLLTFFQQKYL